MKDANFFFFFLSEISGPHLRLFLPLQILQDSLTPNREDLLLHRLFISSLVSLFNSFIPQLSPKCKPKALVAFYSIPQGKKMNKWICWRLAETFASDSSEWNGSQCQCRYNEGVGPYGKAPVLHAESPKFNPQRLRLKWTRNWWCEISHPKPWKVTILTFIDQRSAL